MSLRKMIAVSLILAMVSLLSGCALLDWIFPDNQPPGGDDDIITTPPNGDDDTTPVTPGDTRKAKLWVIDHQGRYQVEVTLDIPRVEGVAREVIKHLVEGGPAQSVLSGMGLKAPLPAGTQVLGINIRDGVCTVDLSAEILNAADANHEELILGSLVYSLTEFPTIDSVVIWINGRVLTKMTHGTPVAPVLSRDMSINPDPLMVGTGAVQIKIWLRLDNMASGCFLVPITKSVSSSANLAYQAVNLLLETPASGSGLSAPFPAGIQLRRLELQGKTATVDLDGSVSDAMHIDLAVAAIVLTLTELPNIDKVKLTISGEHVRLPDGKVLSEPISRPVSTNPLAF